MTDHGIKRNALNMDAWRDSRWRFRRVVFHQWCGWTAPYFEARLREMTWRFWRDVWKVWRSDASV